MRQDSKPDPAALAQIHRYTITIDGYFHIVKNTDGLWCEWADVATALDQHAATVRALGEQTKELLRASERCTCGALGDLRVHVTKGSEQ